MKLKIALSVALIAFAGFAFGEENSQGQSSSCPSTEGTFGFSIMWLHTYSFQGGLPFVEFVYNAPFARVIGGLSFWDSSDSDAEFALEVGLEKLFGEGLLPFGAGATLMYESDNSLIGVDPYFLVETELGKNLVAGLRAGAAFKNDNDADKSYFSFMTAVNLTWYFL
ncbi:MAG: hypothetical protein M0P13_02745 [Fibrobacteraceae bacterium]|nr:hypothetical protein [Fibrobacteraceae bacterium]